MKNQTKSELLKEIERLKLENERLREYATMANQESATMNLEVSRIQRKLNEVFEDVLSLIKSLEGIVHLASHVLENALKEEATIASYIKNKNKKGDQ